ncbi:MAG: M56 family metallopeptidase, partial [Pirellulales bacterium]|nr:M56 family metallopeptidase [Pirellulales bacterium]
LLESLTHRPPPLWLVDAVISPMLIGTGRRAKIIFPAALWSRLDEQSRRLLLTHELEHWRRRDSLVRYLEAIAWMVFWWHPLIWVTRRQIEDCEELCCDLAASRQPGTPRRAYAEAILATLDFLAEPVSWYPDLRRPPMASTLGRVPQLEQRLRSIMKAECQGKLGTASRLAIIAVMLMLPLHPALVLNRATTEMAQTLEQLP